MNFSSSSTSYQIQKLLEANTEKRTKTTIGPTVGTRLIIFIDDMNMPCVDNYGTQEPIAFLRLIFDEHGYYGRGNDSHWMSLKDIIFLAAMGKQNLFVVTNPNIYILISVILLGKSGGGRNEMNPRFLSKFSIINMTLPLEETLLYIYSSILNGFVNKFSADIQAASSKITKISIKLYK